MATPPVPDRHVHTQWSWDAAHGDMLATCARAVELGVPAVAFTEHADFTVWERAGGASPGSAVGGSGSAKDVPPLPGRSPGRIWPVRVPVNPGGGGDLDVAAYWDSVDRCRVAYPGLRIESGVELGEPNLFPDQVAAVLRHRRPDRVLGSMHCITVDGELVDMGAPGLLLPGNAAGRIRSFLAATLDLVESQAPFAILAHLDYPKRYWPHERMAFEEAAFEEEYRAVLTSLAKSGRALEVNTSWATGPRGLCPGLLPLRWWREAGGEAITFGSDAHSPAHLAAGFALAVDVAEAAGFRRGADPLDLWSRG
jgi:histidinol-phosphatase (PHP family)